MFLARATRRKIPFVFYTGQGRSDPFWREWPGSQAFKAGATTVVVAAVANAVNRPAPFRKS